MKKLYPLNYLIIAVLLAFAWVALNGTTSAAGPSLILTDTPTPPPTETPTPTPPGDTPPPTQPPGDGGGGPFTPTPTPPTILPVTGLGDTMPLLLLAIGVGIVALGARLLRRLTL